MARLVTRLDADLGGKPHQRGDGLDAYAADSARRPVRWRVPRAADVSLRGAQRRGGEDAPEHAPH